MTIAIDQKASEEEEIRVLAAERLTFFGDAVIAIALTLLALELPVPQGRTNSALLHSAFGHREEYLAFMISFLVIASHWRSHHQLFRYVRVLNRRLTSLTVYWLLMLVITPFATKLLNGDGGFQARFGFYAAVQSAACALIMLMIRETRRDDLRRVDSPPEVFSRATRRIGVVALAFLASIPVSFVVGQYAYVCWILVPAVNMAVSRYLSRHDDRSGQRPADQS